ncbi:hypothetical protein NBRC110019_20960 [Neptunitalea chrysea]|uniref:Uncharacterized protein n=1 Tax=Neptunitalea chrysea TaxID=1647581 RepID=A0A9W6B5A2_9FLAO|nr:hypothetical protein [Neptunitalea chrysea]GLB53056.1 hypothetical protein NBRC110019_20960 [Neptunitalea chrysea]
MKSRIPRAYKKEKQDIYNKRFGIIFNGEDNLKPLMTENCIDLSPTAAQCADTYQSFLVGGGFEIAMATENLSEVRWQKRTPNDLLEEIGESIARHQGAFVWVGYNANYQKDAFKVLPYELCRVGKKDDEQYSGKIVVSPNGWGKYLKADEVDVYDSYNPNADIIEQQVDRDSGWENYKGQVYFFKMNYKYTYPTPLIDRALSFAEVEYHMGLYYKGTVQRSFEDITYIRHREFPSEEDEREFIKNIEELSGVDNASSKLIIKDDWDDEKESAGNFKFDTIKNDVNADKYAHFESSSSNFIRKAFRNIPPQLIDYVAGKLGNTSGEDLIKAQSVYNALTAKDRAKVERLFAELFHNYKSDLNPDNNWTIKQYALLEDGTINQ